MTTVLNKHDVIERLCELVSKVGEKEFSDELPHDCFCGLNPLGQADFRVDEDIILFIENCVKEKLIRH